jgi:uncharacterized protein
LSAAVANNQNELALALLDAGADPNGLDFDRNDPLLWDAVRNGNVPIARALLKSGARVWSPDDLPVLIYAVASRNADLVRLLLAHGANPNDSGGDPVLNEAVARDDVEIVRALLDADADPNAESEYGPYSPLFAVKSREVLQMLLDAGAQLRLSDYTPLHTAQTPEMVDEFVARGIDMNAPTINGLTPLHSAAMGGRAEVVRRLLEIGADARNNGYFRKTPAEYAKDPAVRRVFDEFAAPASP